MSLLYKSLYEAFIPELQAKMKTQLHHDSTEWLSEWQTENASNANLLNINTFLLQKESSIAVILDDIGQSK